MTTLLFAAAAAADADGVPVVGAADLQDDEPDGVEDHQRNGGNQIHVRRVLRMALTVDRLQDWIPGKRQFIELRATLFCLSLPFTS